MVGSECNAQLVFGTLVQLGQIVASSQHADEHNSSNTERYQDLLLLCQKEIPRGIHSQEKLVLFENFVSCQTRQLPTSGASRFRFRIQEITSRRDQDRAGQVEGPNRTNIVKACQTSYTDGTAVFGR